MICKLTEMIKSTHFQTFQEIRKSLEKSIKRIKSSNLGTKSLKWEHLKFLIARNYNSPVSYSCENEKITQRIIHNQVMINARKIRIKRGKLISKYRL